MSHRRLGRRPAAGLAGAAILVALLVPAGHVARADDSVVQPRGYSTNTLHIKLRSPTRIADGDREFAATDRQNLGLDDLLAAHGHIQEISKLYRTTRHQSVDRLLGRALDGYYTVRFDHDIDMQRTIAALEASGLVESAYPEMQPAPPPTTPSFSDLQTYRDAAPEGTDSAYADSFTGGTGSRVKLVDIEYSWNVNHEDLAAAQTAVVPNGTPIDPFADNNHGTAVLGEILGGNNDFGVTGASYGVSLALVNADNSQRGYDLLGALSTAASITQPGDVIQIEQQTFGPTSDPSGFVPVEWVPEIYDAIKGLTSSGRIVVEAGGNGNQNLDDHAVYGTSFPMGKPDSGAIIVGAGENCSGSSSSRSRLPFSNYGSRVNLQGPGDCVTTTGYGDLYGAGGTNAYYTQGFNGTSSATPVVSAAAASLSSAYKAVNGNAVLSPAQVRAILIQHSTPQDTSVGAITGNIGPYPDLHSALAATDISPPSVSMLQPPTAVQLSTTVPVGWSALDSSGIDHVDVRRTRAAWDGSPSAWVNFLSATTASSSTYVGTFGQTYCFDVRAQDSLGNLSAWSAARCTTIPLRSDQLSYSSHWTKSAAATAFGGFEFVTKTHGAKITRKRIVAKGLSLIAAKCSLCGTVEVRWNNVVAKKLSLYNPTTLHRQLIPIASYATARAGTLTITVISPNGRRVSIEGLVVSDY